MNWSSQLIHIFLPWRTSYLLSRTWAFIAHKRLLLSVLFSITGLNPRSQILSKNLLNCCWLDYHTFSISPFSIVLLTPCLIRRA